MGIIGVIRRTLTNKQIKLKDVSDNLKELIFRIDQHITKRPMTDLLGFKSVHNRAIDSLISELYHLPTIESVRISLNNYYTAISRGHLSRRHQAAFEQFIIELSSADSDKNLTIKERIDQLDVDAIVRKSDLNPNAST